MKPRQLTLVSTAPRVSWCSAAVLALLCLGLSCQTPFQRAPLSLDALERERWARAWIGVLNSRSPRQLEPLLEGVAGYVTPFSASPLSGGAASRHIIAMWQRLPRSEFELRSVDGNRNVVVVEWIAYPGGKAEAPQRTIPGVTVLTIDRGRIRWAETRYNTAALLPFFYPPAKPQGGG